MPDTSQLVMDVLRGRSPSRVRLIHAGESLPSCLEAGFDQLGQLDPSWVWIVERDGKIEGTLLASPCHGTAIIWRLALVPDAPVSSLFKLLRQFLRDCRARKLKGYMTLVDPCVDTQDKLRRVMQRAGAKVAAEGWSLVAGPLPKEGI